MLSVCAADHKREFPQAAEVAKSDFYMDDLSTSADSPEQIVNVKGEVAVLLQKGGFELAKWRSNCAAAAEETDSTKAVSEQDSTSVLGIMWNFNNDEFQFKVQGREQPEVITKGVIASEAARFYDPQGYVTPITIRAIVHPGAVEKWKRMGNAAHHGTSE